MEGHARAYTNIWAGVRGVNYVPSYSGNPIQTFADYDRSTVERELGFAQRLNLNAVRVFLHLFAWAANRSQFLADFDHLVSACAARGLKPLIVLFDDDFFDVPNITTALEASTWVATRAYRRSNWMANPGMPMLGADYASGFALAAAYIDDVAGGARAGDARLLGFDVMNEPSRTAPFAGGLARFISFAINRTAASSRAVMTTVDDYSGAPADLHAHETGRSYHHYYHYSRWRDCATNKSDVRASQGAIAAAQYAAAARAGQPVLLSEFGQAECYCPAAQAVQAAGVGWIAWELIATHDQFGDFQGLVDASGEPRSVAEVECIKRLAKG